MDPVDGPILASLLGKCHENCLCSPSSLAPQSLAVLDYITLIGLILQILSWQSAGIIVCEGKSDSIGEIINKGDLRIDHHPCVSVFSVHVLSLFCVGSPCDVRNPAINCPLVQGSTPPTLTASWAPATLSAGKAVVEGE